ncbi:MAG TPA: sugar phosphate isomerase/epimerase family protein [Candidatus Hydrogenedentes bacterium]|nr:sugar phosphate isomerase/epimerase family protein [Candidatus Hydrogenedentota bacterium]HOL76207.1 sugar phosphate isomerase/epimerase family protein [Candidatus Hydrogenedentota bacterium]
MPNVSRRDFLLNTVAASTLMTMGASSSTAENAVEPKPSGDTKMSSPCICVFSKHLQFLDYAELAKRCKDFELDGVDLTVRSGGHVEPERLDSDLPRAVEAFRADGLEVCMITSNLNNGDDPWAVPILRAAGKWNIPYVRCGGLKYSTDEHPMKQLPRFVESLRKLALIAEDNGVVLGYHNHSGKQNVGAPLWDLHHIIEQVGLDSLGSNFDIGHACVEGGLGAWEINAHLLAPYVKMMAVKDFIWENKQLRWVPLGSGQVKYAECLKIMRDAGFAGPISLHFEYKFPTHEALFEDIRSATQTVRQALSQAGFAS